MAKRVLIADDARIMRSLIRNTLSAAGYEVIGEAKNGQEVVELYAQLKPDLVTMDIVMPVLEGIEAIKRIMNFDPAARVMVITSLGQKILADDALRCGARCFLPKPFQPTDLVKLAHQALEG